MSEPLHLVTIHINGRPYSRGVKGNVTLQNFLRLECGLTGTKKGCELGVCGCVHGTARR